MAIRNRFFPANVEEIADKEESKNLPSFGVVATIILIPLVLILLSTASDYIPMAEGIKSVLGFLGEPFVALTIATLVAMYFLGTRQGYDKGQLKKILDHSLRPVGMILLVIASGGVIRWMLQDSGLGNIIGPALEQSGMPLIIVAFLIAFLVRASVGSSIVAMTMASGIMATMPATADCSMLYKAAMSHLRTQTNDPSAVVQLAAHFPGRSLVAEQQIHQTAQHRKRADKQQPQDLIRRIPRLVDDIKLDQQAQRHKSGIDPGGILRQPQKQDQKPRQLNQNQQSDNHKPAG